MKSSPSYRELEKAAHALMGRHGALLRVLRGILYTDGDAKLSGLAAQFELLIMLEDLDHRPPIEDALQALDLTAAGQEVVQAHRQAISQARTLAVKQAELGDTVEGIYKALAGQ